MTSGGLKAHFKGRIGEFKLDARFEAPGRGLTALFGVSGCGKTTVLRCLAGLVRMPDGSLKLGSETWQQGLDFTPPHKRAIGYVFQDANLFPHLDVVQNLQFGMKRAATGGKKTFDDIVHLLRLEDKLDRNPATLSGGEKQRVAMGRALLTQPDLLLMDEPLSALDRFAKDDILPYFEGLAERLAIPIIYVTHDLSEVERLADHMVLMEEGRVRVSGPLLQLLPDLDLPMSQAHEAGVVLNAHVWNYDLDYDLTTLDIGAGHVIVPGCLGAKNQPCRIRLLASNISLNRHEPDRSTILNVIPATIRSHRSLDKARVMVRLTLGNGPSGPPALAQITRKSWDVNDLEDGLGVFAQIKGASLLNEGPMTQETKGL